MAVIGLGMDIAAGAEMLLVNKGVSPVPIIVAADAPLATTRAVEKLAESIEKISGAKPEILVGTPDPMPDSAIWVGPPSEALRKAAYEGQAALPEALGQD